MTAALLATGCSATPGVEGEGDPIEGGELTVAAAQGIPQLNPAIRTFAWDFFVPMRNSAAANSRSTIM